MAEGDAETQKSKAQDLVLYHCIGSSYSEKVLLALHEKKLNFKSELVDLQSGENFKPWFMKMNPKGEVPVLKDGCTVIPDSSKIIEYLEEKYSVENPCLIPEKGAEELQKVREMRKMLESIPFPIITFGSIFHPELTTNSKIGNREKKGRIDMLNNRLSVIDSYAEKYPDFKNDYMAKKEDAEAFIKAVKEISSVKKHLEDVEVILDVIEEELASHTCDKQSWWLCSSNFTVSDVLLTLLLHRMDNLGHSERFFCGQKRPHVQFYYGRVQERDSFKKTF